MQEQLDAHERRLVALEGDRAVHATGRPGACGACLPGAIVPMNGTTDYLEAWIYQDTGGNATIDGTAERTWINAIRVG